MLRIGIVGHRRLASERSAGFVANQCSTILRRARLLDPDAVALSAIAEGADSIFASAAVELGIPLEIVRPFDTYSDDFAAGDALECYRRLRGAARRETRLVFGRRSVHAYRAAMLWIVRRSDVLVVAWDGCRSPARGGTWDAVTEVVRARRHWIHIDPVTLTVHEHPGRAGPRIEALLERRDARGTPA
jgi:hypothetical protein